jgi:DNA-directed RNA polymerase subunit RPC12/RpoP
MNEGDKESLHKEAQSLSETNVSKRVIDGHELHCPVCQHNEFWKRRTLMNTPGLTFLGMEWANKEADNYVCDSCGHVLWFMREV